MANIFIDRMATERREGDEGMCGIAEGVVGSQGVLALVKYNGLYDPEKAFKCLGVTAPKTNLQRYDNSAGADGAILMRLYFKGKFPFDVDSVAPPTATGVGCPLFAVDNHTVSLQPYVAAGVRPFVGYVATEGLEGDQCWVNVDPFNSPTAEQLGAYAVAPMQTLIAATPVVVNSFQTAYPIAAAGAITLTAALPVGVQGQVITFVGSDNAITFADASIANLKLAGAVNCVLGNNDTLTLIYGGGNWVELCRSLNA